MPDIHIVSFNDNSAEDILWLRRQVFTLEQGVDEALDMDGKDDSAIHCVIYQHQRIIGTGRLLEDGHIGRVSVLPEHRHKGWGKAIMLALMDQAAARKDQQVFLHAQITAQGFYEKLGFSAFGKTFLDAGLLHIAMKKPLA